MRRKMRRTGFAINETQLQTAPSVNLCTIKLPSTLKLMHYYYMDTCIQDYIDEIAHNADVLFICSEERRTDLLQITFLNMDLLL